VNRCLLKSVRDSMIYMLDTNICIYTMKKHPPGVFKNLRKLSPDSVGISAITEAELRFGMSNSSKPEHNHRILDEFLGPFQIVPFDSAAAAHYGEIRSHLRRNGTLIGNMDLLIAAHARSLPVTLVTNNMKEFERVPGLKLENWVA
jgi:tRNA(fMet)-specific endonuclease VapC